MFAPFKALARRLFVAPQDPHLRDEAYLAQALDLHDLENRMRELERGRRERSALGPFGIALR
jgi:hypothetical protein